MRIKGLETSKNLLKLIDAYESSDEGSNIEECKIGDFNSQNMQHFEEKKGELTELPADYDLIEEVKDEDLECD